MNKKYNNEFLELELKRPGLPITDRQWRCAKWRWEFIRLNDEYKKESSQILTPHSGLSKIMPQFHKKWGIGEWLDANLSFEELYEKTYEEISELNIEDLDIREAARKRLVTNFFDLSFGPISIAIPGPSTTPFTITIDPYSPDTEIIEEVKKLLKEFRSKPIKKPKWGGSTLELCHQAITLKNKNKTVEEIAEIMFPASDNKTAHDLYEMSGDEKIQDSNLDSDVRRVYRLLKTAEELIKGGHRQIN